MVLIILDDCRVKRHGAVGWDVGIDHVTHGGSPVVYSNRRQLVVAATAAGNIKTNPLGS